MILMINEELRAQTGQPRSEFIVLEQSDEARYEFAALKTAFNHAVDLPYGAREKSLGGNLSWGSGSLQGKVVGIGDEEQRASNALQMGLNFAKALIRYNEEDREEHPDAMGFISLKPGKKEGSFESLGGGLDKSGCYVDGKLVMFKSADAFCKCRDHVIRHLKLHIASKALASSIRLLNTDISSEDY